MLSNIISRFVSVIRGRESIILPPGEPHKEVKKEVKIAIFHITTSDDLTAIRPKLAECSIIFLNIAGVKESLKTIVDRLKVMADQFGHKIYGLDPRWLLLTKFEIEKNQ